MKWFSEDMPTYIQSKEYIDTAIVPLQQFQLTDEENVEKDAFQREVLSIYASEIEKELSGRILLTPTYHYLKTDEMDFDLEVNRLNEWVAHLQTQPFKHIFIMTFDSRWKKMERNVNGELLWLPGIKKGNVQSEETIQVIKSQVEQISELIRSYWS